MKHVFLFVTTTQGLHFDRSHLVELWQIKEEVCGAGFEQTIGFVAIWSGQKRSKKNKKGFLTSESAGKSF